LFQKVLIVKWCNIDGMINYPKINYPNIKDTKMLLIHCVNNNITLIHFNTLYTYMHTYICIHVYIYHVCLYIHMKHIKINSIIIFDTFWLIKMSVLTIECIVRRNTYRKFKKFETFLLYFILWYRTQARIMDSK